MLTFSGLHSEFLQKFPGLEMYVRAIKGKFVPGPDFSTFLRAADAAFNPANRTAHTPVKFPAPAQHH